jgi:hypothetical protein
MLLMAMPVGLARFVFLSSVYVRSDRRTGGLFIPIHPSIHPSIHHPSIPLSGKLVGWKVGWLGGC